MILRVERITATRKPINHGLLAGSLALACLIFSVSCGERRPDPHTFYRPKFFREGTGVPFLDENNIRSVQLVEVDNPFPEATRKRIYGLWFALDGRGRYALHAETGDFLGDTIHMFIAGQSIGYHPIQAPIDNGVLPILLPPHMMEADARFLHQQLERTIVMAQRRR